MNSGIGRHRVIRVFQLRMGYRWSKIKMGWLLFFLTTIIIPPAQVLALSKAQIDAFLSGVYYFNVNGSQACATAGGGCTCSFGPGTLPATIPEPSNGIFTAAAAKSSIPAAMVAATYYIENNGKIGTDPTVYKYREPPPPYGNGAPWPVSSAQAKGPFQFLDGTWESNGIDGNGDGVKDQLDLTDAAFGAANYLKALLNQSGNDIETALGGYEAGHPVDSEYGRDAYALYQFFLNGSAGTGGSATGCSINGYANPLRDIQGLVPMRIDQGVDYGGGGPVYAIGNGKVTFSNIPTGWPGPGGDNTGGAVSYQLSDGPAAGKTVFFAENCIPSVKVGDPVTSNTVICQMQNGSPFTETGWARDGTDVPMASDVYKEGHATAFGVNFSDLMVALGAPAGTYQFPGETPLGTLPSGWPAWK